MKNNFLILILIGSTIMMNSCSKDECDCNNNNNNSDNWAASVEGTYTGTGSNTCYSGNGPTTLITRISNTMLNLQISFSSESFCLDSVSMNSPTTFSVNEYDGCWGNEVTGGGNFSGNNISYTLDYTNTGCTLTYNGSK